IPGARIASIGKPRDPRAAAAVHNVVVLQTRHRSPTVLQSGICDRSGNRVHVDGPRGADRSSTNRLSNRVSDAVVPCRIKSRAAGGSGFYDVVVYRPIFGDLDGFRLFGTQRLGQVLTGLPAAEAVHDADLIEAESVDP